MHASDHGLRVCGDASILVQHMVVLEHVALRAVLQHDVRRSHTPYSMLSASARRASGLVPFCSKRNLLCGTAVARAYTSPLMPCRLSHGCFGSTAVSSQPGCPLLRHVVPWQQSATALSARCCCVASSRCWRRHGTPSPIVPPSTTSPRCPRLLCRSRIHPAREAEQPDRSGAHWRTWLAPNCLSCIMVRMEKPAPKDITSATIASSRL